MKPEISRTQLDEALAGMEPRVAYMFRVTAWTPPPAHGLHVDQRRIGDRFLELLAAQHRPRVRTRPQVTRDPGGGYTIVDEVQEWRQVGYTTGGGTVWVAPLRRERAQGWSKAPMTPAEADAWFQRMTAATNQRTWEDYRRTWIDLDTVIDQLRADAKRDAFRREVMGTWTPQEPDPHRLRELRSAARDAVMRLAEETDTPAELLPERDGLNYL